MGNHTSCNPSSCASTHHSISSVSNPSAVAKVLLVDGRVLHFTSPVKAIHVLLDYPHQCLCPASSLRLLNPPAPVRLLPDDELQLGQLYFLIPLETFQCFVSAASRKRQPTALPAPRRMSSVSKHPPSSTGEISGDNDSPSKVALRRYSSVISISKLHVDASEVSSSPPRRSFEVQRATKRLNIRRCKSWRPRLRVINEVHVD